MTQFNFENVNYRGLTFTDFYVRTDHSGPGWFVFGRNSEFYGVNDQGKGNYVMRCAWPNVAPRRYKLWNGRVRRGWRTKHEAQAVANKLNALHGRVDEAESLVK